MSDQKRWFLARVTLDDLTSGVIYGMRVKKWVGNGQNVRDPLRRETHWANEDDAQDYQDLIRFMDRQMDEFRRGRNRWRLYFAVLFVLVAAYLIIPNIIGE